MKEPSASLGSPTVPAFLTKLWVLVEDPANCDVIAWNWNGQNFCILDEQRFSKEILPKYFKHNNLSSFIRQLNMYGFRKVMSLESGLLKSESGSVIEFQHPFFKKGRAELLENIKRKVSAVKTEDTHLSQENLQKVLAELHELRDVQSNMDSKLENMRRENEILWKEVSSLRRKHSQQQKLLAKILQFILSIMKGNIVMGQKRKRPLTIEAPQSPATKYSRHVLHFPEEGVKEVESSSQHPESSPDNVMHDIFSPGEGTSQLRPPTSEQQLKYRLHLTSSANTENNHDSEEVMLVGGPVVDFPAPEVDQTVVTDVSSVVLDQPVVPSCISVVLDQPDVPGSSSLVLDQPVVPNTLPMTEQSVVPNSSTSEELALDVVQESSVEDPDNVINSILNENVSSSNMLDRDEIQDFLSCIDASLEDLQNTLSRKKLNIDPDVIEELFKPDLLSSDIPLTGPHISLANELKESDSVVVASNEDIQNKGKQVVQYTGNPLLSLFDELPSSCYGTAPSDPANPLTVLEDNLYPSSMTEQGNAAAVEETKKEPDLFVEDYNGSHGLLPIFVLSPVNKLIDEVTEPETI
ncbi:heat shock factor protein 3-like [Rhinophrynus dorsalis]